MNSYLNEIHHKLRAVIEHEKRKDGINNILVWVFSAFLCLFLDVSLEAIAQYGSSDRTDLFYGFISLLVFLFIAFVVYPFIKDFYFYLKPNYVDTAKKVGDRFPEIKDELSNALQLIENPSRNYSDQLVDAAFKRVYEKSANINFASVVDFSRTKKMLRLTLVTAAVVTLSLFFIPALNSAAYRLFNYEKDFSAPPAFVFKVSPGNKEITKGENVFVSIKTVGKQPAVLTLFTKTTEQSEPLEIKLTADSLGNFNYEAVSLKSSTNYYAYADGITSETYKISVINRPIISSLNLTVIAPAYSKLPTLTQKDNGNVTALPGSKILLSISASRELSKAKIVFSDSSSKQMKVKYTIASTELFVSKQMDYQTIITDAQGFENSSPISYSIKTFTDSPPSIELISPTTNVTLGNETKISL
ncbi:MAG: hypothetical protein Q8S39_09065, partial [Ignavibacteria bacterium]|nr:hypothetical protein [Ignavibacteria bacterium]